MTRRISFEGIDNFRDFGDYPGARGHLKRGVLYRSAHHANASDKDLEALAALGLSVIVDLRRPNERERDPSRRWPDFAATVIDNDIGQGADDEFYAFLVSSDLSVEAVRDYLTGYYRKAPFVARHLDLYARYFQALAETEGPVLVHCAAGKDRTGVICALTHHIAGVSDDHIVEDYLLTNDPERLALRTPQVVERIRQATGRTPSHEAVRAAIGVDAVYLREAFAAVCEAHGSLDGYLEQALGVTPGLRARIEARIVA